MIFSNMNVHPKTVTVHGFTGSGFTGTLNRTFVGSGSLLGFHAKRSCPEVQGELYIALNQ